MLMHGGGGTMEYVGDRDSCLIELQLSQNGGGATKAQLRIGDQPQKETDVVIPIAKLNTLSDEPNAYGAALGEALFKGTELGIQFEQARAYLAGEKTPMRFRVVLNDAALDLIRWERLCQFEGGSWVPIASGGAVPFSRFVYAGGVVRSDPVVHRPVRVLLVVSSPNDLAGSALAPIDPAEARTVWAMFNSLGTKVVEVNELSSFGIKRPTLDNLIAAVVNGWPDIVHVLCHGVAEDTGTSLLLERPDGNGTLETQASIVSALRSGTERPRLVFFAACNSALPSGRAALVSLGPALAATGIDAVLAMSDFVTNDTAQTFATQFYERLFVHGKVDRAANEARALVQGKWDWGVPVLYNFASEGRILDFDLGGINGAFLGMAGHVARTAAATRNQAQPNDVPATVMTAVDDLIKELEKSHKFLVQEVATPFREVGDDPLTFKQEFNKFFSRFKGYYDYESWRPQNTSCGNVMNIGDAALPFFKTAMQDDPEGYRELENEIITLGSVDDLIIESMSGFLETMNAKVEEIRALLNTDLERAMQLKRDFEEQLSPSFRRSRELLADLGRSATRLQAA
jgi:hypothetical protein